MREDGKCKVNERMLLVVHCGLQQSATNVHTLHLLTDHGGAAGSGQLTVHTVVSLRSTVHSTRTSTDFEYY